MNKFRRAVLWCALVLIILLIVLSIYGAFAGAERAKGFFNSLPLGLYWSALTVMLIAGIGVFRRLVREPALLLIHGGCVLILTGSMWGSAAGHELRKKLLGIEKIPGGKMAIFEGQSDNHVKAEGERGMKELPFHIKLKDFRIEYYKPEYLDIESRQGQHWQVPVEIGGEFSLGADVGTVIITKAFENFKITFEDDKSAAYDDPEPGYNPALEVQIRGPDGGVTTDYVFERYPGHVHPEDKFLLSYHRTVRDYISELAVIKDDKVVLEKNIEVNHPLHFGGYHFYQHSYDEQGRQYTVLEVVSDSGLIWVYAGYLMLCIAVFWHLWLREFAAGRARVRSE
ncbi:MAG TPA: cytochrome c biogenesis protein ResB [Sedimentisphaerales bacterium]|nr:cytochrome c biogenesis protein ResB [Sedimentisphaerales bacterium]